MSDLLPDVLKAIAGPVVSTAGGIATAALGRSWSNEDWKNQTRILNEQAIANAKNSPLYLVEGLRKAGLNPALAAQGGYTPAPVQSAPKSVYSMPVTPIDLANVKLAKAQADNLDADTRAKDIENKRRTDEDITANAQFRAQLDYYLQHEPKDSDKYLAAQWLMAQDAEFSSGSIKGSAEALELRQKFSEIPTKELAMEFERQVIAAKLKGEVPEVLARLDKAQLAKLGSELAEIQTRVLALGVGMEKDKADIQRIVAETANILEDTDLKHYSDFTKLVANGEGVAAAAKFLDNSAAAILGGLTFGGIGVAGKVLDRRLAPTSKKAFDNLPRVGETRTEIFTKNKGGYRKTTNSRYLFPEEASH